MDKIVSGRRVEINPVPSDHSNKIGIPKHVGAEADARPKNKVDKALSVIVPTVGLLALCIGSGYVTLLILNN